RTMSTPSWVSSCPGGSPAGRRRSRSPCTSRSGSPRRTPLRRAWSWTRPRPRAGARRSSCKPPGVVGPLWYTRSMALVRADLVFTEDRWCRGHAFVMQGGRIVATGEPADLHERFPGETIEDWGSVAVLPGTINGHGHSFQTLLRGYGDDLAFPSWRDRVLHPLTAAMDRDAILASALFDFAEMA